jgi:hypothetical protein
LWISQFAKLMLSMLKSIISTKRSILIGLIFIAIFIFGGLDPVLATQTGSANNTLWGGDPDAVQGRTALGNDDPRYIIANIINIVLGFLGILAIIIIMYAGFLWMMSNGNPDQIGKAKKTLISGVIGLIIVLSAFAIAAFILDAIFRATTDNFGNAGGSLPGGDGGGGGGGGGGVGDGYENLIGCSESPDECSGDNGACDALGPRWSCHPDRCVCVVDNIGGCYNEQADVCNLPCSLGLSCYGADGCHNNTAPNPCGAGNETCRCCCDPNLENDRCADLYPSLECVANSGSCTGNLRGLCCGCDNDNQCGDPNNVGCGDDTCCNDRPEALASTPSNSSTDVCTNALISVEFDQAIRLSSVANNFLVVGEHTTPCPPGTRLIDPATAGMPAAPGQNLCAVSGSYSTRNTSDGHFVDFYTANLLTVSTDYHILLIGDQDTDDNIDQGIQNYWGISMNSVGVPPFGFRTVDDDRGTGGVCVIEAVELTPASYLIRMGADSAREDDSNASEPSFDTESDDDKLFQVRAISKGGQEIVSSPTYQWEWVVTPSPNTAITLNDDIPGLLPDGSQFLVDANEGVTDDRSVIRAEAVMPAMGNVTMEGNHAFDTSEVFVFICSNPWPPIQSGGTWSPWRPDVNTYNYEIHYCRDSGSQSTVDDLPAFDGQGVETDSIDDTDPVIQQALFTYQTPPPPSHLTSAISALADPSRPDGGAVQIEWALLPNDPDNQVMGYKVYWGESSGNYTKSQDAILVHPWIVEGLENGRTYYFTVTAYTADKAESPYFKEMSAVPKDEYGPTETMSFIPAECTTSRTEARLRWNEVVTAYAYEFAYGLQDGSVNGTPWGIVENVGKDTSIVISGLTPNTTYYFGIRVIDAAGNGGSWVSLSRQTAP